MFAYQLEEVSGPAPSIALRGLDADATYELRATDLDAVDETTTATGAELAAGLAWPLDAPLTARLWELTPLEWS